MTTTRYIYLVFLSAGFLVALVLRSAAVSTLLALGQADAIIGGLMPLSTLIGVVSGFLTFFILLKNRTVVGFTNESVTELAKVTWPDREETVNSSIVVVVATIIFSGSLAVFDFIWANVTEFILFQPG